MKKKIFAALASVMMLGTALTSPVSAAETYQKGDVNMDGRVDVADALLVMQEVVEYFTGNGCSLDEEQIALASITGFSTLDSHTQKSLSISVGDAQTILKYYVAKDVTKEIETDYPIEQFFHDFYD